MSIDRKTRREVVKEIRRRYAKGEKSMHAIIREMRSNSAYTARMNGICNEWWRKLASR